MQNPKSNLCEKSQPNQKSVGNGRSHVEGASSNNDKDTNQIAKGKLVEPKTVNCQKLN